jgi:hypothetical protein
MKKIFLLAFALLFVMTFVMAADGQYGTGSYNANSDDAVQNGSVISTQNQGEDSQIQVRTQLNSGSYFNSEGKEMQISVNNGVRLMVGNTEARSTMNVTQSQEQNRTRLHVQLSNGTNAEIKIMPDTASETAIARLRLVQCNESNNCTIELKEVGSGEQVRAAYEVQAQKEAKVLGLFRTQMQVEAQVDAETGEVIREGKPWWAFFASE